MKKPSEQDKVKPLIVFFFCLVQKHIFIVNMFSALHLRIEVKQSLH